MKRNKDDLQVKVSSQPHSKLFRMFQRIQQFFHDDNGFSLVEAIVSVVILGIAIVPISMVFTQTIHQTVDTRKQLEANELAQNYIEGIKNRPFDDYHQLFNGGYFNSFDHTSDTFGLSDVPEGYRVDVSLSMSLDSIDSGAYQLPSINAAEPVDAIVEIDSSTNGSIVIRDGSNNVLVTTPSATNPSNTDRTIQLDLDRSSNELTISYYNGVTQITNRIISLSTNRIRFVMGNDEVPGDTAYLTKIVIDSDLTDEFKVNIYEGADNTIQATTEVVSGLVSVSRNLKEVDAYTHRIVEIKADVYDVISGKLIASLSTTKVDE